MWPLAIASAVSSLFGFLGAKKASDTAQQAQYVQQQGLQKGMEALQQGQQTFQNAYAPFTSGNVAGVLGQYAWNPQTRQAQGMSQPNMGMGGMTLADLYRINTGQQQRTAPLSNMPTYEPTDKAAMSDLSAPGAFANTPSLPQPQYREPIGSPGRYILMTQGGQMRYVPFTEVGSMAQQGWTAVQSGGR